jgi:spore maturation protein CgeB
MSVPCLEIVILGLSITSSWGNGHATTYRGLMRELVTLGHRVLFLERDVPWYAAERDLPHPPYGQTMLYTSLDDLKDRFTTAVRQADLVMVGSYVPEGVAVGAWATQLARGVTAFYDIDTPVTLSKLSSGDNEYLSPELIPCYDLYLSFTGGSILPRLERDYGATMARPLYCSADPTLYMPEEREQIYDLGYLGTYSADRQLGLDYLLLDPARHWRRGRFIVAGPQYPTDMEWPTNVEHRAHLAPVDHALFYNAQRFTLNITRADMRRAGYAPSVRLFEAAACATPVISDDWEGIGTFFIPGEEILISQTSRDTLTYLREFSETQRRAIGDRARARMLAEHTAAHRAKTLESYVFEARQHRS